MMKVVVIVFVLLCVFKETESSRSDLKRLQSKVDFFLDTILDINHNIRELREIVNNMDNQNASCVCDLQQDTLSREVVNDTDHHSAAAELFIDEFESKMTAVQRGFLEEKSVIRKMLKQQDKRINDIAKNIDDSKTKLQTKFVQHLDETIGAMANVSDALDERHETVSNELNRLSDELTDVNSTCDRHMKSIESEVEKLSDEMNKMKTEVTKVSNNVQDVSSLERELLVKTLRLVVLQKLKVFDTSVYMFHEEKLTWTEAQQKCQEDRFHLAEINNDNEDVFVKSLVGSNLAWLGATDVDKEGDWRWSTSGLKVMASLWEKGEPNNSGNQEHCLHNYGTHHINFNDVNCEKKLAFVCELEL